MNEHYLVRLFKISASLALPEAGMDCLQNWMNWAAGLDYHLIQMVEVEGTPFNELLVVMGRFTDDDN